MKYLFGGDAETTYAQYLDLATGRTLVAQPGKTYDLAPAEGHEPVRQTGIGDDGQPVYEAYDGPPDDNWKPVKARAADTSKEIG